MSEFKQLSIPFAERIRFRNNLRLLGIEVEAYKHALKVKSPDRASCALLDIVSRLMLLNVPLVMLRPLVKRLDVWGVSIGDVIRWKRDLDSRGVIPLPVHKVFPSDLAILLDLSIETIDFMGHLSRPAMTFRFQDPNLSNR